MKKKIILITIILISITLFILTPYLLKELFNNPDTRNTLINYMGALYGGLMTIIGVVATIIYEKEERKKDIELQYKPLIKLEEHKTKDLITTGELDIYENPNEFLKEQDILKTCLIIKNIGRGEMLDIKLFEVKAEYIYDEERPLKGLFSTGFKYDELAPNDFISYSIVLPKSDELYKISFKISFYGCMNKVKNTYLISFCIDKSVIKNDKLYNYRVTKI